MKEFIKELTGLNIENLSCFNPNIIEERCVTTEIDGYQISVKKCRYVIDITIRKNHTLITRLLINEKPYNKLYKNTI